ncbi:diguanylate cyclase [Alcaligenaceae bacterium]|nr:diguanylate cyclase [Alcaligenaceae bacterium]
MPNSSMGSAHVRLHRITFMLVIALLGTLTGFYVLADFQHVRKQEQHKPASQAAPASLPVAAHLTDTDQMPGEIPALPGPSNPRPRHSSMQPLVDATPIIRAIGVLDGDGVSRGIAIAALETDSIKVLMMSALHTPDVGAGLPHAASAAAGQAGMEGRPPWVVTGRQYLEAMADWHRLAYLPAGLCILFAAALGAALLCYRRRRRQYDRRTAADRRLMQAREQDYRIIVEHTANCIVKLDTNANLSYVNPAFSAQFGIPCDLAAGRSFFDLMADDDGREQARRCFITALMEPAKQHFRAGSMTPQGLLHLEWTLFPVTDEEDRANSVIGLGHDVSEYIVMHDKLRHMAQNDGLTGLPNRRHFMETATVEVNRSHRYDRYDRELAILMIDLDHFKAINDTWGHQAGDIALQICARTIRETSREFDIPARIGGEEFSVLLPNTAIDNAFLAAERLRLAIAAQPIVLANGAGFHLTTSIGLATLRRGETLEDLMKRADAALYAAKRNGRNRVEIDDTVA